MQGYLAAIGYNSKCEFVEKTTGWSGWDPAVALQVGSGLFLVHPDGVGPPDYSLMCAGCFFQTAVSL